MRGQTSHIAIHHCSMHQLAFPAGLPTFYLVVDADSLSTKGYKFPALACLAARLSIDKLFAPLSAEHPEPQTRTKTQPTPHTTARTALQNLHVSHLRTLQAYPRQNVRRLHLPLSPLRPPGRADDPGLPQAKEP